MMFRDEYKNHRLAIWQAGIHGFTGVARPGTGREHVPAAYELNPGYFAGQGGKARCLAALKQLVDKKAAEQS